jgi:hypothetical protein
LSGSGTEPEYTVNRLGLSYLKRLLASIIARKTHVYSVHVL